MYVSCQAIQVGKDCHDRSRHEPLFGTFVPAIVKQRDLPALGG
ncbi:hypothetical protein [Vreelandella rituensis]|nr:hypothetical protein [Halomonas rituensis]